MTGDEILALLQQGRGQEIDFKAERTSARKLAESLVALANASGGAVLVGADPRTSASGSAELSVEGSAERFSRALSQTPAIASSTFTNSFRQPFSFS